MDADMERDARRYRALRDACYQAPLSEPDDPSVGLQGFTDITIGLAAKPGTFPTIDAVADRLLGLDAWSRAESPE